MASTSSSKKPVSGGTGGQEQRPGRKDKDTQGDRFDWARVVGSALTAFALIVVAIVGAVINSTISSTQRTVELIALQANRETVVDSLRAEVFGVLAQNVITKLDGKEFQKVALLAAFHGNFSKYIDTRPVFEAFLKEVHGEQARHELRRLAKRVARRQADYIAAHGGEKDRKVVHWRRAASEVPDDGLCVSFDLPGHKMTVLIKAVNVDKERPADDVGNTVDVEVTIADHDPVTFSVTYLDAPYMDNVFVIHPDKKTHRIALLLSDITETGDGDYDVMLEALHFPANIIMPVDVPSAQVLRKALEASGSHEPQSD